MDITLVAQIIHATTGIGVIDYLDDIHINSLIDRGYDEVVAFECRHGWEVDTPYTMKELFMPHQGSDYCSDVEAALAELKAVAQQARVKYQLP